MSLHILNCILAFLDLLCTLYLSATVIGYCYHLKEFDMPVPSFSECCSYTAKVLKQIFKRRRD